MTAKEAEEIAKIISDGIEASEGSDSPLYVLISLIVIAGPATARYVKKVFVKEIKSIVDTQLEQVSEMLRIMGMHIDELQAVKEKGEKNEKDIKKNRDHINNIKRVLREEDKKKAG